MYLSDFGLSKGARQASGLTGKGIFLGTLDYISPEQIEGKLVDGRADQYALACAAFEILSGTPPFQRDEATAVMYAQLSDLPQALSRYRAGLPLATDAVFVRALSKSPDDRFGSCRDFAEALRRALGMRSFDSGPGDGPSQGNYGAGETRRPGFFDAIFGDGGNGGQSGLATAGYVPRKTTTPAQAHHPAGLPSPAGRTSPPGRLRAWCHDHEPAPARPGPQGGGPAQQGGPPRQVAFGDERTELPPAGQHPQGQFRQGQPPPPWQPGGGIGGPDQYGGGGGQRPPSSSRRKAALTVAVAVIVLIVGGVAVLALTTRHSSGGHGGGGGLHQQTALTPPGCAGSAARGPKLRAFPAVPVHGKTGQPFGIAMSADGKAVFVVTDTAVKVYRVSGDTLTPSGPSYPVGTTVRTATTATVTRDGRYLLVAADNGIKVLDAVAAEKGEGSAILGTLAVPGLTKYGRAVGVAVTPDDKFAFVSLQFRDEVGVFSLGKAIRDDFKTGVDYFVGSLDVGAQPVGLTMSSNGDILYATAFRGNSAVPGTLSVVDVTRATSPAQLKNAVISQVTTGCFPARVVLSQDGKTVWVTARESNYLLGYSASALLHDPGKALIAEVQVGKQPIGIAIVSGGKRIVVSDDNNTTTSQPEAGNLAVIDTAAALRRKPALLGYIPAGVTPHEMVVSPNGRVLYVTDTTATSSRSSTSASCPDPRPPLATAA